MCSVQSQKNFHFDSKFSGRKLSVASTDDQKSVGKQCKQNFDTTKIKYKTELCKNFSEIGFCRYGKKCRFAHGYREMKRNQEQKGAHYRTKKCLSFWSMGECSYGSRCQFSHSESKASQQLLNICGKFLCESEVDASCSRLFTLLG